MNNLFNTLIEISDSTDSLDKFLNENMQVVTEFYNSDYNHIVVFKDLIERFILDKHHTIAKLDYTKSYTKSFVLMLLDYCERFNFIAATPRICSILNNNHIAINSRLEAALLFLYPKPKNNSELVDRFDAICEKLQLAVETEEDDDSKVLATFFNYYSIVVDINILYSEQVKTKLTNAIDNNTYSFLEHSCIHEIVQLDLNDTENSYKQLQCAIDKILNKKDFISIDIVVPKEEILIEEDSEYTKELALVSADFDCIRNISVQKSDGKMDTNRGVKILNSELELYAYLRRFGNMHKAKLQSAFESLPNNFSSKVNIIDWGCGQGIASMIFIEKFGANIINGVTLIEPSEIAIKRASLHIKKYNPAILIKTICKKLDDLTELNIENSPADITIHLFSNILDIDDYKQSYLINLIETTQTNLNYFVCASPWINDQIKMEKIESFKRYFEKKYDSSFQLLKEKTNSKVGVYWKCNNHNNFCYDHSQKAMNYCSGKWTRVIKVFSANL